MMTCYNGLQLETTAERVKAVDLAAAMVEEMLKQPIANSGVKVLIISDIASFMVATLATNLMIDMCQVGHLLNTCIFLGFEVDPSVDIASRIRGPNVSFSFVIYTVFSLPHILCFILSFVFLLVVLQLFHFFPLSSVSGCQQLVSSTHALMKK